MSATKYTYSIQSEFPNHKVSPSRLTQEIRSSAIVIALDYINTSGDDCDIWFKDALSAEDETILDGVVASHSGEPLPSTAPPVQLVNGDGTPLAVDSEKKLVAAPGPRLGSEFFAISANLCDPRTWHTLSVKVTDETLVDSGDGLTFDSAHPNWIDLTHGRVYGEDYIIPQYDGGLPPTVTVEGTPLTERPPFSDTGGDYLVDYSTGQVTFFSSQAGKVVQATYRYATGSLLVTGPTPGKIFRIENAHVQFSADVVMNDTACFQVWAWDPANPGQKMPVSQTVKYKTARDFVDEANGFYPVQPAFGGPTRGVAHEIYEFPFAYKTVRDLAFSMGLEIRVWLENDQAFEGEFCTITFYGTSLDEA